jgi:hypothetical protein
VRKPLWPKGVLLALSVGTTLALYGGCLSTTLQRILVAVAV